MRDKTKQLLWKIIIVVTIIYMLAWESDHADWNKIKQERLEKEAQQNEPQP